MKTDVTDSGKFPKLEFARSVLMQLSVRPNKERLTFPILNEEINLVILLKIKKV